MRGRRRLVIVIALSAILLAGGVVAWRQEFVPRHFQVVQAGVLYRSAVLPPRQLQRVLADYAIRTVVNLRSPSENREDWHGSQGKVCRASGARCLDIPLEPETPPDAGQIQTWLKLLQDPEAQPILVHCKRGAVRTGAMVALYEIEFNRRQGDAALDSLPMWGHEWTKPQRKRLREFIQHYRPTLPAPVMVEAESGL